MRVEGLVLIEVLISKKNGLVSKNILELVRIFWLPQGGTVLNKGCRINVDVYTQGIKIWVTMTSCAV